MRIILLLLLIALPAPAAQEGGHETGNGGGGAVCERAGTRTVRLLDLWEGEALRGLKISRSHLPARKQLLDALDKYESLNPVAAELREFAFSLHDRVEVEKRGYLASGVAIAAPLDARTRYLPKRCRVEGIALYNDFTDQLELDRSLYRALPETDKAALFFHEAVYKYLREKFAVKDSVAARNLTACVFSRHPCPELNPKMAVPAKGGALYRCRPSAPILFASSNRPESLFVFPAGHEKWSLQWEGSELSSRVFVDLPLGSLGRLNLSAAGALLVASRQDFPDASRVLGSYEKRAEEIAPARRLTLERIPFLPGNSPWSILQINGSSLHCQAVLPWVPEKTTVPGDEGVPPNLPRRKSLVRYFSLQDTEVNDKSPAPTLVGESGRVVNPGQRGLSREVGRGLRFHGKEARIEFLAPEQDRISFSAWVQTFSADNIAPRVFDFPLGMLIAHADHWEFRAHWDVESGFWSTAAGTLKLKTWQHVVVTYDRRSPLNQPVIYVDGVPQALESQLPRGVPRPNQSYPSRLGNIYTGDRGLNGTMRSVAIWNDVLSAPEVRALYEGK